MMMKEGRRRLIRMEEEFWPPVQQPLALWSTSSGTGFPNSLPPAYSNQPGCSTPLASPVQKGPPSTSFDQFGQSPPYFSPHAPQFQQQQQQQQFHPQSNWHTFSSSAISHPHSQHHYQNQPFHYVPPPPPLPLPPPHPPQFPHPPPHSGYFYPHQEQHHFPHHHEMPLQQQDIALPPFHAMAANSGGHQLPMATDWPGKRGRGSIGPEEHQREERRSMQSQQKVQQWQQFGMGGQTAMPQDSGVNSMSQSTANSVMSMSSLHPQSCMSAISSLPDEYPGLQEHPYFRHMPTSMRHEEPEKMRKVLPELIPLINDEAEEIVLRALTILSSIAKKDKELTMAATMGGGGGNGKRMTTQGEGGGGGGGPLIGERRVVEELLRTLKKHKKNKKVACYALKALHFILDNEPSGRELFVQTVNAHGTGCLEELVQCIGIQEHSCFKYAFLLLHNLMSDGRIGRKVIAYMCEMRILTKVLGWLTEKNERFLNIVTDIIDKLISRNSEQMAFFIGLNGHQKLINILSNCHRGQTINNNATMAPPDQQMPSSASAGHLQQQQQPQSFNILYRVAKLLYKITQMDPAKMISAGLLEAAQKHLLGGQTNPRFLRQLLDCIRAASHVPSTGHQIQPLLLKLLQLLGTNDIRLKESCTDILANWSANNAQNKEFLVENGAIYSLFHLLYEMERCNNNEAAQGQAQCQQRDDIEERAMALMKSLCTGNDRMGMAKMQVMGTEEHKRLLLERLRQQRNLALLRRTLMFVKLLAQDDALVGTLHFTISFPPPPSHSAFPHLPDAPLLWHSETCSFAKQLVFLLYQSTMNSLPEMADICQRCLDILRSMAAGDKILLEEIYTELVAREVQLREGQNHRLLIPQLLLCFNDQLAPNSIALLAELARIPQAVKLLQKDEATLECLRRWATTETQSAQLAIRVLQLIEGTNGQTMDNQNSAVSQHCYGDYHQHHQRAQNQSYSSHNSQHLPHPNSSNPIPTNPQFDCGEELSAVLNNSPDQMMDFSSPNSLSNNNNFDGIGITNTANYHSSSSASQQAAQPQNHHQDYSPHPHHQLPHQIPANSDQLSTFPGFGQFPEIPQDSSSFAPDEFSQDFGPFVSAICPPGSS